MARTITGIIPATALLAAACGSGTTVAGVASLEADEVWRDITAGGPLAGGLARGGGG